MISFDCGGDRLCGSLDEGAAATGLLVVSGGNEIRSGAYAGQAAMARHFASKGYPVFRYDRRGVGDSEGVNGGFESSADDLLAAATAFRSEVPHLQRIVAFGNCDAATALAFFHVEAGIASLVLANPWIIDGVTDDQNSLPSAAAIRARYWTRLKNPRSIIDLLTGKIDLRKLTAGLEKATSSDAPTQLSGQLRAALSATEARIHILVASQDNTALEFLTAWRDAMFEAVRKRSNIRLMEVSTASHSFADPASRRWLYDRVEDVLKSPD
jgi:exosortase A-associated hydrolase 1